MISEKGLLRLLYQESPDAYANIHKMYKLIEQMKEGYNKIESCVQLIDIDTLESSEIDALRKILYIKEEALKPLEE